MMKIEIYLPATPPLIIPPLARGDPNSMAPLTGED